jgi:hypothetical protein
VAFSVPAVIAGLATGAVGLHATTQWSTAWSSRPSARPHWPLNDFARVSPFVAFRCGRSPPTAHAGPSLPQPVPTAFTTSRRPNGRPH